MKIYLDYNATTPLDPEVVKAMQPYLNEYFGNPSSSHSFGTDAKKAVEQARKQVANLINCKPGELVFTSGGTESNNYAIKGYAFAYRERGNHIITSTIEHPAVMEVCKYLESNGFSVSYIPVDEFGVVQLDLLEQAITPQTILITIMHSNNEVGTLQPIAEIARLASKYNLAFHTDAAQSVGKYHVDVKELGVDMLSIAGHKLYAPKGIGALYIKDGIVLEKLMHGANHEQNKRAGTENVIEIVGLGKACEIARRDMAKNLAHMQRMRELLHGKLMEQIPNVKLNGHPQLRLPNTLNVSFKGIEANMIISEMEREGIAASAGAACHTDSVDVSQVLKAINLSTDFAMGTIRFSVGRYTTADEVSKASEAVARIVNRLRPDKPADTQQPKETDTEIRLTQFSHGLGCACKIRPQVLEKILKDIPVTVDPNVLIDVKYSDDAAVYRINETTALVKTIDFFAPIVDDPYDFGTIAATNALSDIYAMGAKPIFALNVVCFPANRLPIEILREILRGASDKAKEAGIAILGGHSVDDNEPKFGMVVSGLVHPQKIWSNAGAKPGDAIILTKPIGTGINTTAIKRGLLNQTSKDEVIRSMSQLNRKASEVMQKYTVHACTDVTGFGLMGHLSEVTLASKVNVEIHAGKVPLFRETENLAAANVIPGGSANNLSHYSQYIEWANNISDIKKIILCDAQTSGGLLFFIPDNERENAIDDLKKSGVEYATHIGNSLDLGKGTIHVVP